MSQYPQLPILDDRLKQKRNGPIGVLTLTPFYPARHDDGNGCFVAEPLNALEKQGVVNTVFALQPFYRNKTAPSAAGVPATWLRYFSLPRGFGLPSVGAFAFARILSKVREMQASGNLDLIHAHGALPCGHAAMLLSSELGVPYVITVHGLDAFSTEQVKGRAGEWCRRISQRVYQSARRVICISERVREEVLNGTGSRSRTSVVYNGVDPELFSPRNQPANSETILSVGNLIPIKEHATLIKAFAELAATYPKLKLDIIGTGPELSRLQQLANQSSVGTRVNFLGRRSRVDVARAMQECEIFALPSRFEGLGCVYLEAMACGKPAIGCRGQGIAEVIQQGHNGFLVGSDNEKELTLVLKMLLQDLSLREKISVAARDTIVDRFTVYQQAQRLARIYEECVG